MLPQQHLNEMNSSETNESEISGEEENAFMEGSENDDNVNDNGNDGDSDSDSDDDDDEHDDEPNAAMKDSSDEPEAQLQKEEEVKPPIEADAALVDEPPPGPINSFSELGLDPRVERAIEQAGWIRPTPVQRTVIPMIMHGLDVLVSAPTGSGKTGTYAIPIVQSICQRRNDEGSMMSKASAIQAVILVPTRELVHQVTVVFKNLCRFIDGIQVSSVLLEKTKGKKKNHKQQNQQTSASQHDGFSLKYRPAHIIVGTPAAVNALQHEHQEGNPLSSIHFIVIDEADLILSYGNEKDANEILKTTPVSAQSSMFSATLDQVGFEKFRQAVMKKPTNIKIDCGGDDVNDGGTIAATHYVARVKNGKDRFLVTYAMLRLNVLCGKALIFVNSINGAFRLKLFLDQFKVQSAVLNSELPANSRLHCVNQFNSGVFDILIAVDESPDDPSNKSKKRSKKPRKILDKDEEFGLSRGVDFKDVAVVLNFDVPHSGESYTHRAGRTARGGKSGTVLSLVCDDEGQSSRLARIADDTGIHIGPLAFRMEQIEAFRYRVEDCLKMVTDSAIQGARLTDVKRELMNSEQLKTHFEQHPDDYMALQHNLRLAKNVSDHLGHIPSYLLPLDFRGKGENNLAMPKRRKTRGPSQKKVDPLKKFSMAGSSRQRFKAKRKNGRRNQSRTGEDGPAVPNGKGRGSQNKRK